MPLPPRRGSHTGLIRLGPVLQLVYVVVEFLGAALPLFGTALLQIRVVSLPEFFIGGSDVFNESGASDNHEQATALRGEC